MPAEGSLLALQRDVLAALREPLVGDGRAATALAARDGEPSASFVATATRHLSPSSTLDPVERLDLYRRQYWYRVLDSLQEDFPALERLLGGRVFWEVAEAYLEATPSRSGTLRHLGSQLPGFLALQGSRFGAEAVALVEVAKLEYALCLAFEAGEHEPVDAEGMEDIPLGLQPHLQLFALRTPADEIWRRAIAGEDREPLVALATAGVASGGTPPAAPLHHVVVFRDRFDPAMERVDVEAWRLLAAIQRGATLAGAIDASGLDPTPEDAARLQAWFSRWTSRGWLRPAAPVS